MRIERRVLWPMIAVLSLILVGCGSVRPSNPPTPSPATWTTTPYGISTGS